MSFSFKKNIVLSSFLLFTVLGTTGCQTGEETIANLSAKAEKGDVDAMVELGEMYCGAKSVEQDDQICGIWIRRAAEKGHKRAQYMLGRMYELGIGMREDPVQSYRWFTVSASQGYEMSELGAKRAAERMNPKQMEKAKKQADETIAQIKRNTPVKN